MLVLSRKVGQRIVISDAITLTVTKIRGNKVWLGFKAPRDVPIARDEIAALIAAKATIEVHGTDEVPA